MKKLLTKYNTTDSKFPYGVEWWNWGTNKRILEKILLLYDTNQFCLLTFSYGDDEVVCYANRVIWADIAPGYWYHQTSNISRTSVGNGIVDYSDIVGAGHVGAASTTSSLST